MENYNDNLTDVQKNTAILNPTAADGNPAIVTEIVWSVDSGDVTITPSTDGFSCDIVAGAIGVSQVSVQAKADDGTVLQAVITVTVTASTTATGLNITFTSAAKK